jgi:hypothetical protein
MPAKKRRKKLETGELIPADNTPVWSVVTDTEGWHRLLYGRSLQEKANPPPGLERLREIASHCNRRKLVPRDRIECVADLSDPKAKQPRWNWPS